MFRTSQHPTVLIAVWGTSVAGLLFLPPALAQRPAPGQDVGPGEVTFYAGGAREGVQKIASDQPATTTATTFELVPAAVLRWFVPAGDSDLLQVTFTAECRLIGGRTSREWVEIAASISTSSPVDGYPKFMEPFDSTSPLAFCADDLWESHSAGWVDRVPQTDTGVIYTVEIQYRTISSQSTAWLDDYVAELDVSD